MNAPITPASAQHLLLVDDNDGDVLLFREALSEKDTSVLLDVANGVDQAIAWLESISDDQSKRPCVILMDLHMPRKNGQVLLEYLQQQPAFSGIPAVVLSSSTRQKDIDDCLARGAHHYRVKPHDWQSLQDMINALRPFWNAPAQT